MTEVGDVGDHSSTVGRIESGTRIYLVRHGETAWSLTGQHTGRTDIPLTARGEEQARSLAPTLGAIAFDHVLSSPAKRARDTCDLAGFAERRVIVSDLAEWDYGDYEGKRSGEIGAVRPSWNVYQDGCPGGESPREITARADRAIASILELSGTVLVFSHGQFGCCLAARWIGLPVAQAQHLQMDPASLSILAFNPAHPDVPVIARWNGAPILDQCDGLIASANSNRMHRRWRTHHE